ncbi:DNA repair protein RadC [Bacteroides luti]|jgi:DNA repair protein RadC|uniref:DNA repair protein RadC n=1 Tax=Bacteroides luti TaxID=1297750 RepID=A0A1M5G2M0_9BACE|nr:DNA repair protein RadC [Bacteroides luti]SHF98015.1 DNA repair protein RadC [Bacteroides luti]
MKEKLTINQWAEEDRPREKMLEKGIGALTDAELLAILIGSGNTEETAVELMRRVLASCNHNLNELGKLTVEDLCTFKGIGPAKAISICAASELGKRRKLSEITERNQVTCSTDVYNLMHPLMCDLPTEECWVLLLNQSNKVIDKVKISSGGISETSVDVRCVLREALIKRAVSIILCHNHPSGNTRPSKEDDKLTSKMRQAGEYMNINLADHLIVCDGHYYSYVDEGRF